MSDVFKLSGIDWIKILKGLGVAIAGAALTYISAAITGTDFGQATPVIVAGWSVAVNFLRKLLIKTEG